MTQNEEAFAVGEKAGALVRLADVNAKGRRSERALAALMERAAQEPAQEAPTMSFETTSRGAFVASDLAGVRIGARVMQTQDGGPVTRDTTFLVEHRIMLPEDAQRMTEAGTA